MKWQISDSPQADSRWGISQARGRKRVHRSSEQELGNECSLDYLFRNLTKQGAMIHKAPKPLMPSGPQGS